MLNLSRRIVKEKQHDISGAPLLDRGWIKHDVRTAFWHGSNATLLYFYKERMVNLTL